MKKTIIEIVGWVSVVLILGAYILSVFEVLHPSNLSYMFMNLFGGIGIVVSSYVKKNLQPVIINAVWFAVAAIGIARILLG